MVQKTKKNIMILQEVCYTYFIQFKVQKNGKMVINKLFFLNKHPHQYYLPDINNIPLFHYINKV